MIQPLIMYEYGNWLIILMALLIGVSLQILANIAELALETE